MRYKSLQDEKLVQEAEINSNKKKRYHVHKIIVYTKL